MTGVVGNASRGVFKRQSGESLEIQHTKTEQLHLVQGLNSRTGYKD